MAHFLLGMLLHRTSLVQAFPSISFSAARRPLTTALTMEPWTDVWNDIVQGGSQRWKVTDDSAHKIALSHMKRYMREGSNNVLCPLSGDDPMVHLLWQQGHLVTAMDLVPTALQQMRNQFDGTWTSEEILDGAMVLWKHESGRATQYQGDALKPVRELRNTFDVIYDKDSFGALQKDMRQAFCARMGDYAKEGAVLYVEVALRDDHEKSKNEGPPFSLKKEDLVNELWFGKNFEYVEGLGSVYPVSFAEMQQTGHVLRRK